MVSISNAPKRVTRIAILYCTAISVCSLWLIFYKISGLPVGVLRSHLSLDTCQNITLLPINTR
ncbi:hypothetical protein CC78DRAFT_106606 [Lojkania enalia]|uniref:Uncharacterized protein n=1 Tax=Lojkania enalia TaxID=147567 RepID=A0A9P4JZJ3_9PLEO|nr:hypothetical protein CC78DRAFT_106606 [Didymosphaeria enalia]